MHDYSGHPFQVELSRELARRGHRVVHQFSADYVTGHGVLDVQPDDPDSFAVHTLPAGVEFRKYDLLGRLRFELGYARAWSRYLRAHPEIGVVVACNVPLFALAYMRVVFARRSTRWVLWHQDVYSGGVGDELARRLPNAAAVPLRWAVERVEQAQVRSAEQVVAISDSFVTQYEKWGLSTEHVTVVPNWAPLDDITPGDRENSWTHSHGVRASALRIVYAGTLGRKHNPLLLLQLQRALRDAGVPADLLVCSEGVGADELAEAAGTSDDVRILGFQPAQSLPDVLAAADVTVALLEPDAAAFSVPSKVLSYLAAGRPIILLAPTENPAAADVQRAGGFVASPTQAGVNEAATWLADVAGRPGALCELGRSARRYAEERFGIDVIADRFEDVLQAAAGPRPLDAASSGLLPAWRPGSLRVRSRSGR